MGNPVGVAVGRLITEAMARRGVSMTALAAACPSTSTEGGVSLTTVRRWMDGEQVPDMERVEQIIAFLGISGERAAEMKIAAARLRAGAEVDAAIASVQHGYGGSAVEFGGSSELVLVPVIDRCTGEEPAMLESAGVSGESVPILALDAREYGRCVGFRIDGDEMVPRLAPADTVIAAVERAPAEGGLALVCLKAGHRILCRRWYLAAGQVTLVADAAVAPIVVALDDVHWAYPVVISQRREA